MLTTVHVSVDGHFSDEGRHDENLINAPVKAHRTANKLALPPGTLEALQKELGGALDEACAKLKLSCVPVNENSAIEMAVRIGGDNGLGGHFGGTDLRFKAQRGDVFGRAMTTVEGPTPLNARAVLEAALENGLGAALGDLQRATEAEAKKTEANVDLVFLLQGLAEPEQRHVVEGLAPCAAALIGTARPPQPKVAEGLVTLHVVKKVELSEHAGFAEHAARTLEAELGPNGKQRCTLFGTPLAGRQVRVAVAGGQVRVAFDARR